MKRTALFPLATIVSAACHDPTEMLVPPPDRRPVGRLPDDETAELPTNAVESVYTGRRSEP